MNTTELIEILKRLEKGASGRSREISFSIKGEYEHFMGDPIIEVSSTGDGCAGAEICFLVTDN